MNKVNSYLSLIRFYNPIGFWLLLWPGLWGLFLTNSFEIDHFTIVVLGSFLTRSLGCAINDLLDHKYDREVDRTKDRPLANGELSFAEGIIFTALLGIGCLYLLSLTNVFVICFVAIIAIPMILLYPLMKRFLGIPQLFLGLTFGLSLPISFAIVNESISMDAWLLYLACVFWIVAYDSYYALCDIDDDRKLELNSLPIFFGDDTRKVIVLLFTCFILLIICFAKVNNLKMMSIGVLFLIYQAYFQNKLSKEGKNLDAFKSNSHVGLVIAVILFLENQSGLYN